MLKKYMNGKSWTFIASIILFSLLTLYGYLYILDVYGLETFQTWAFNHFFEIFFILLFIKVLGIVWPPLPGGVFIMASVPALGWFWTWVIDALGVFIGASIAYFASSKYGMKFLSSVLTKDLIDKLADIHPIKKNETEMVFVLTLMSGPVAEAIYYASALLKVEYRHFIVGVLLANMVYSMPSLYIIEHFLTGKALLFNIVLTIGLIIFFSMFKKRYFKK